MSSRKSKLGSGSKLYSTYSAMTRRCYDKNFISYPRYGGRGIEVCSQWRHNYPKFEEWALNNGWSEDAGLSIDRIDGSGNYEPHNCRLATQLQQQRNRRNNHRVEYRGEELTLSELAEKTGIHKNTLQGRLARGWSVEEAVAQPRRKPSRQGRQLAIGSCTMSVRQWAAVLPVSDGWLYDQLAKNGEGETVRKIYAKLRRWRRGK